MPPTKRDRRKLGARPYKNYSDEMLKLAINMVRDKQMSSYAAEKNFGIPRRTIEKKIKLLHSDKPGPKFKLNAEEESNFVKVLIAAAEYGAPLTQLDLRLVVFDYLKKNNKADIFGDKPPGEWWVKNFLNRHRDELTVRSTQNIKRARAEKTLAEFQNYFEHLSSSIENVPPSHILNYDETNVSDDPGSEKCIFRRGVKYPERVLNTTKGSISIMFSATADGSLLAPYVVYKSECMWNQWVEGGPEDARYNRSKSGWFDASTFFDWFTSIVIPWAKKLDGPKVVIGDNLSSHINLEVVKLCEQYNIRFILLPPNSTQLSQPLDVAFFGPLKKVWRKTLKDYKIENPRQASLNKAHFPLLLKKLIQTSSMNNKENIKSGFRATGIFPFCPRKVFEKLPEYAEEISHSVDEALLNYLKENRQPHPIRRKTNKKINVPAGKSITLQDLTRGSQSDIRQNVEGSQMKIMDIKTKTKIRQREKIESTKQKIEKGKKSKNSTSLLSSQCDHKVEINVHGTLSSDEENQNPNRKNEEASDAKKKKTSRRISSTSEESTDIIMSVHSDSDILDIPEVDSDVTNCEDEENVTRIVDDIEANIWNQIATEIEEKKYGFEGTNEEGKVGKNTCNTSDLKLPEKSTEIWDVGDTVLVRYYVKKSWKYYIGLVEAIDDLRHIYTIAFYKTVKKDCLKFVQTGFKDRDQVPYCNMVKKISMLQTKKNPDTYVLEHEEDMEYF